MHGLAYTTNQPPLVRTARIGGITLFKVLPAGADRKTYCEKVDIIPTGRIIQGADWQDS